MTNTMDVQDVISHAAYLVRRTTVVDAVPALPAQVFMNVGAGITLFWRRCPEALEQVRLLGVNLRQRSA